MKTTPRNLSRFFLLAFLCVGAILGAIHYPAQAMAIVCLGGASLVLCVGAFFWEASHESKEYNEEHDL